MIEQHKRFVVYTVMVGGYDRVLQPLAIDDRFDYVLFTDNAWDKKLGVWQVRTFDYYNDDKTRMSRYPKMHPEELLPDYEASLYIDANIQITGAWVYERFIQLYDEKIDWCGRWLGDSLYDHIYVVLLNGFESPRRCIDISHKFRNEGFPRDSIVFENNVIFRMYNETVKKANLLWWKSYNEISRRDQVTLPYVLRLLPEMKKSLWVSKGDSTWRKGLIITGHSKSSGNTRFPYHSYAGYVQLQFMNRYSKMKSFLNNVFYKLSSCDNTVTLTIVTLVSWFIFVLYAPVVYSKKYFGKSRKQ